MPRTRRAATIAVLLMGAMALAQPEPEPSPPPPAGPPAEAPDASSPAPAPAPRPPEPKPELPKPEPKPEPPKPEPKPEPPKPEPKPEPKADAGASAPRTGGPPALNERARAFFAALLAGEPGPLVQQAELPFFLEDKRFSTAEQLKAEWLNQLRSKRTDLLVFKGFEVLTPAEMEQRFGKPPARLSSWPISSGRTYLVVANVSGRALVALYHQVGEEWRVVAYHD